MAQDLSDQRHTVRFPAPYEVVYDKATTLRAPVWLNASLVAPAGSGSSTVTIYDSSNTKIVDGASATISGSIAEYTVAANTFAEGDIDERVRVEWSLTGSGLSTTVLRPENDGLVVKREIYPCIGDGDLIRKIRAIDPSGSAKITSATTFQDERDDAWAMLTSKLIQDGTRPAYVMSPSAFRETLTWLSLANVYRGILGSRIDTAYGEQAREFEKRGWAEYAKVVYLKDKDGDAIPDQPGRQGAASQGVWLGGAPVGFSDGTDW